MMQVRLKDMFNCTVTAVMCNYGQFYVALGSSESLARLVWGGVG